MWGYGCVCVWGGGVWGGQAVCSQSGLGGRVCECASVWKAEKPWAEGLVVPLSPRPTPGSLACAPPPPSPSGRQQVHTGRGACSGEMDGSRAQASKLALDATVTTCMHSCLPGEREGEARRPEGGWVGGAEVAEGLDPGLLTEGSGLIVC